TRLILIEMLKEEAYSYQDGLYEVELYQDAVITIDFIKDYISLKGNYIFIGTEDFEFIQTKLREQLIKVTRSLSIGDPLKNGARHANLLTMQLESLYDDPFNDEL